MMTKTEMREGPTGMKQSPLMFEAVMELLEAITKDPT